MQPIAFVLATVQQHLRKRKQQKNDATKRGDIVLISLFLGIALVIIHYYSELIHLHSTKRTTTSFLSFAAGISVAYLFLYLLPELTAGIKHLDNLLFFFLLAGFTLFHLVEKYIYQHSQKTI